MRSILTKTCNGMSEESICTALNELFGDKDTPIPSFNELNLRNFGTLKLQAYAELILQHAKSLKDIPHEFLNYSVFNTNRAITLKDILSSKYAASNFPICSVGQNSEPRICHLYLIQFDDNIEDHRKYLTGSEIIDKRLKIFITVNFEPLNDKIDGKSWQCAYKMAENLIFNAYKKEQCQNDLRRWLITGAVVDDQVDKVELGDKENLTSKWKFLYPEANKKDLLCQDKPNYFAVSNLDIAWRKITGIGVDDNPIELPSQIDDLHILVGGKVIPILLAILSFYPKKVYLWHSDKTETQAIFIKELLADHLPILVELNLMASNNLQQCYSDLDILFKKKKNHENDIISITGGNRIMGFAAMLISQTYSIDIVYKDIDVEKFDFTAISLKNQQKNSSTISVNKNPYPQKINWNLLFNKPNQSGDKKGNSEDLESLKQSLFL